MIGPKIPSSGLVVYFIDTAEYSYVLIMIHKNLIGLLKLGLFILYLRLCCDVLHVVMNATTNWTIKIRLSGFRIIINYHENV
jgi:hypothetical protein